MARIINVCSGKGGVGKTTIVANLGAALTLSGRKTAIIDCNLTTPHLGLMFGFHNPGRTLNNFLRKESPLEAAVYVHPSGMRLVPASLDLGELVNVAAGSLKNEIKNVFDGYDYVLLDSAPGIGREALIALRSCDRNIFVASPYIPSLIDVLRLKNFSDSLGIKNIGVVLNRVRKKKHEIGPVGVYRFADLPVIGVIPEDEAVLRSLNSRTISVLYSPKSPSARAIHSLAKGISSTYESSRR